jgi:hypothetical protein
VITYFIPFLVNSNHGWSFNYRNFL